MVLYVYMYTTEPAYSPGPLSAHQRNAIQMAFRRRANCGPLLHAYCDKVLINTAVEPSGRHDETENLLTDMFNFKNNKTFLINCMGVTRMSIVTVTVM